MQFKRMMSFMLIALLSVSLVSPRAIAADSDASIEFIPAAEDDIPDVLDPTEPDPEQPYEPGPEEEGDPQNAPTGEGGPLTLDYVSSVAFGQQEIEASTQILESETLRPFIQVTDRRGSGAGWYVNATMGGFTDESGNDTLPGAVLTFSNGTVISETANASTAPVPQSPVALSPEGEAQPVVTAVENSGLGSWITRWFPTEGETLNDNVTLTIPAGSATTGDHTAIITWNLEAVPMPTPEPEPEV